VRGRAVRPPVVVVLPWMETAYHAPPRQPPPPATGSPDTWRRRYNPRDDDRDDDPGTGSFVGEPESILGSARAVAVGRLDLDNRLDVAVAVAGTDFVPDKVAVLLGKANGRFRRPAKRWTTVPNGWPAQLGLVDIAIADLNGDGLNDVVTSNGTTVSVLLNETLQQP